MTSIAVQQPKQQIATNNNNNKQILTETTTTTTTKSKNEEIDKYNNNSFKLDKEREDFTNRLIEFHRHKNVNTPLASWPTLNGRAIDLHKLYSKVMSIGGWEIVCEKDKWNDVGIYLDKASFLACTNGAHALRLVYIRYLSMFEKFNQSLINNGINGTANTIAISGSSYNMDNLLTNPSLFHAALNTFSAAQQLASLSTVISGGLGGVSGMNSSINKSSLLDIDKTDELALISKRKFSYLIDSTSMNYNYNQHHYYANTLSDQSNLQINNKLQFNPYEKLEISLISGLPNEIDFVFNTILLLSSDEYHMFRIYTSTRLIDLMLAHIGFFGQSSSSAAAESNSHRNLYDNVWQKNNQRNYVKFWHNSIQPPAVTENDEENNEIDEEFESPSLNKLITNLMPKLYNKYLKTLPSHELLNLQETITTDPIDTNNKQQQTEFRRIEQVMIILNNLSFEENNAEFMANKSSNLIEFLIMCIYCTGGESSHSFEIKKHALDILVNLSRRLKLKSLNEKHKRLLLMSICYLIIGNCSVNTNTNTAETEMNTIKEDFKEQGKDRLDITRGLEILTKLFAQQIDPNLESIDYSNETILAQYYLNEMTGVLFLNKILIRLEQLLTVQDVFILMHTLECLYSMSQFNEILCNLIVSNYANTMAKPRIVSMLVNFLTVDTTHFGMQSNQSFNDKKQIQNLKIYKVSNGVISTNNSNQNTSISNNNNNNNHIPNGYNQNQHPVNKINSNNITINNNNSLLQQTLNNQHHLNTNGNNTVSSLLNNNNNNKISNNLQQQQQVNHIMNSSINSSQNRSTSSNHLEQQAKNVLCNWLRTCFQTDSNSELSKTKLYPYYQQIAKINNWMVLTIPTFFEILNATFPSLRYNDATNQIHGIKLVVNTKQQLQLKKEELIQQAESEVSTWPQLPENNNNIKIKSSNSPIITTTIIKTNGHTTPTPPPPTPITTTTTTTTTTEINGNLIPTNKLPTPLTSINVITPSILPLLTPPTPPPQPGTQTDENLNNNLITNGSGINTTITTTNKQTSKLLNDTSNVNNDQSVNEIKKYEKKLDCEIITKTTNTNSISNTNNDDPIINNIERRIAINNENSLKQSNGISNDQGKLINGNVKHLTNGHADNHSVSSTSSTMSEEDDDDDDNNNNNNNNNDNEEDNAEKMEEDGQIESFRKRKTDNNIKNNQLKEEEKSSSKIIENNETLKLSSPIKKQKITEEKPIINEENNLKTTQPQPPPQPPVPVPKPPTPQPQQTTSIIQSSGGDYICEWNNCKLSFNSAKSIYSHVCKYHLLNTTETNHLNSSGSSGSVCLWLGCDQIKRQKWSLVNHIQERHCNENALKNALMCRQRGLIPNNNNNNSNGTINLNYSKDAAFLAIQKNQRKSIEDFLSVVEEGPISKSVRLLSALTLRNLARNSDKAKLIIKSHELVLTEIAFDLLESSNVLANCLWHLTN